MYETESKEEKKSTTFIAIQKTTTDAQQQGLLEKRSEVHRSVAKGEKTKKRQKARGAKI